METIWNNSLLCGLPCNNPILKTQWYAVPCPLGDQEDLLASGIQQATLECLKGLNILVDILVNLLGPGPVFWSRWAVSKPSWCEPRGEKPTSSGHHAIVRWVPLQRNHHPLGSGARPKRPEVATWTKSVHRNTSNIQSSRYGSSMFQLTIQDTFQKKRTSIIKQLETRNIHGSARCGHPVAAVAPPGHRPRRLEHWPGAKQHGGPPNREMVKVTSKRVIFKNKNCFLKMVIGPKKQIYFFFEKIIWYDDFHVHLFGILYRSVVSIATILRHCTLESTSRSSRDSNSEDLIG